MSAFVLDTSVALAWVFEDEFSEYASRVARVLNDGGAAVPVVWPLEVANGLLTAVRRGRLREADPPRLFGAMTRLRIDVDWSMSPEPLGQQTIAIGLAHRLSSYDASYLELALRRGLPLATQDVRLAEAATAAGVELWSRSSRQPPALL